MNIDRETEMQFINEDVTIMLFPDRISLFSDVSNHIYYDTWDNLGKLICQKGKHLDWDDERELGHLFVRSPAGFKIFLPVNQQIDIIAEEPRDIESYSLSALEIIQLYGELMEAEE